MASSQTSMRVRIESDLSDIKSGLVSLRKDLSTTKKAASGIGAGTTAFASGLRRVRAELVGIAGIYLSLRGAKVMAAMADEAALLRGRLREAKGEYSDVLALAQRSRAGLTATVDLYARLERSTRERGVSQEKLLALTESINQAVALSYTTTAAGEAALFQLSQGLGAGALRGEELNSVMEQTPRLAKAIADGLGVPIGQLRALAKEGKLTTDVVTAALETQAKVLEEEFKRVPVTISSAMTTVRNSMLDLVGDTDDATGATKGLTGAISDLATGLNDPNFQQGFRDVVTWLVEVAAKAINAAGAIREFFAANREKGNAALVNRRNELETTLFRVQRRNRVELDIFKSDTSGIESEIAEIDALLAARRKAEMFSGVTSTSSTTANGGAGTVSVGGDDPKKDKAKAAAKRELTAAEKDLLAIEEAWADGQAERTERWITQQQAEIDAGIEARQAAGAMQQDIKDEIALTQMSAVEKEKFIALRYLGAEATDADREAIGRLVEEMDQARKAEQVLADIKGAMRGFAVDLKNNVHDAGDALEDFLERLAMIAYEFLTNEAINGMFDALKSSGKGAGTSAGAGGNGGFWASVGSWLAGMFHTGGIAGAARGTPRNVNPLLFGAAPRYHSGGFAGLGPGEVAAVLMEGEEVLTENDPRHTRNGGRRQGGTGELRVEVNNYTSGKVEAGMQQSRGPDGDQLRKLVINVVAEDLANGGRSLGAIKGRLNVAERV